MQEMDAGRSSKLPLTEIEIEQNQRAEALLTAAQTAIDEEHDDVKLMNKMTFYAKVVTVRDKQLEENKQLESEWLAE